MKGKILTDFERKKKVTKILFHSQSSRYYSTAWWKGNYHTSCIFHLIFPSNIGVDQPRHPSRNGVTKNVTTTTSHGESWFHPLDFTELQPPSLQDFTTPWARYPNLVWRGRDSSEGTRDFGYRPTFDRFAAWTLATREMARGMSVQRQNLEGGNY